MDAVTPVTTCSTSIPETSHVDSTLGGEEEMNDLDSDFTEPNSQKTPAISMQRAAAIWVLKTRRLPQSTTEGIMQDVGALYDAALSNLHADVTDAGVESATISEISSISVLLVPMVICLVVLKPATNSSNTLRDIYSMW